jgi:hypothetical protein
MMIKVKNNDSTLLECLKNSIPKEVFLQIAGKKFPHIYDGTGYSIAAQFAGRIVMWTIPPECVEIEQ